jgi:hypothetical protein
VRGSHRSILFVLLALAAVALAGCGRHTATPDDCRVVLDRIIELELTESGYRDSVLRARWQQDLGRRFAPDVERCRGLTVRNDLHRCVNKARTPEDVVHGCLN